MIGVTILAVCTAFIMDYFTNGFTIGGGSITQTSAGASATASTDDLDALMEDDDDMDGIAAANVNPTIIETVEMEEEEVIEKHDTKKVITKHDLVRAFIRSFLLQICWNFERMQGLGFCYCMLPILKKLYKNKPEKLQEAVDRHNVFFNTNPTVSAFIVGTTMAMEENVASGGDVEPDTINTVKISLMGPLAGIGDSLIFFTLVPITQLICCNLIQSGNYVGPVIYLAIILGVTITLR